MKRNYLKKKKKLRELGCDSLVLIVKNISKFQLVKGKITIKLRNQLEEDIGKV